jgi:hypothetical protein
MKPVESEERAYSPLAIVEASPEDGRRLAAAYWSEVERTTGGLVRVRLSPEGLTLRALGAPLLRFSLPSIDAADDRVTCRYPIEGGLLASRPGGSIAFAQHGNILTSTISGFHPRLALLPGLYSHVQARIHAAVSRRYFARLVREGAT